MNTNADTLSSSLFHSIRELIEAHARVISDAIAIVSSDRHPLTYSALYNHVTETVALLNLIGVSRNDRVAIVLPNGPEMATAFISVAAGATAAPLNPSYRAEEFEFYLSDINAKALIVQSGMDSPARAVAQKRGIHAIELTPVLEKEAGIFALTSDEEPRAVDHDFAESDDVALVLHTSGTTSRPKIVPLTQSNICTSAHNIRTTLALEHDDRCLNVMPLFHIHGLIGVLLSSLTAGASVACTPGFYAPHFFEWMEAFDPTWYSAVPTMHQAILERAASSGETIGRHPLRLIRSSSSALPPQVMADLERVFNAPVIESYGMTEASHQMASNQLPPLQRKAGSVGMAAGPEIAIMNAGGHILPQGDTGEIVIRGANVTKGYENNPTANETSFTDGWFRTGDQGYFDSDGYLFITGRLKEIINRGGEKISPREIDEVLLDHPAIAQVVTFAVPHPKLGEDIAAAVILNKHASATEPEIQEFAAARLADFKVPHRVILVNEIPKGPTGKLQRIGLAERLGVTSSPQSDPPAKFIAPRTSTEEQLAEIWSHVLRIDTIGVQDNFFHVGGDSILAADMISHIHKARNVRLSFTQLLHAPTIEQIALILENDSPSLSGSPVIPIQPNGSGPPFFCVPPSASTVLDFAALGDHLSPDQPLYGLQPRGLDGDDPPHTSVAEMATYYIEEMRKVQPEGPYLLGGKCLGGIVAFEMAQQLLLHGQEVSLLVILGMMLPPSAQPDVGHYLRRVVNHLQHGELFGYAAQRAKKTITSLWNAQTHFNRQVRSIHETARREYQAKPYPGRITMFWACERSRIPDYRDRWAQYASGGLDCQVVSGSHNTMLQEPYVHSVAQRLRACIEAV